MGFVVSSIATLAVESIRYLFTRDQLGLVTNLSNSLLCRNVFYVKILQAVSADCQLLDQPAIDYLTKYTDNVDHTEEEVRLDTLDQLVSRGIRLRRDDNGYIVSNSGMVSLVYRGHIVVGEDRREVAVKVMRRGIESKLAIALEEMEALVYALSLFPSIKSLNLHALFHENRAGLLEQLDYWKEVENIDMLYNLNRGLDYVAVPKTYPKFTKGLEGHAIVMDYLVGRKLQELRDEEKAPYSACLAKFDVKCLLFDGVFHGDFHQGNILFMGNMDEPRIGVIDMGVLCTLTRDEQNDFYQFFQAILSRDYRGAADSILRTSAEPREKVEAIIADEAAVLITRLAELLRKVVEMSGGCGMTDINGLNSVLREYDLRLTKLFCRIQFSLALAEGVHRGLETERNFVEELELACTKLFPTELI